MFTAFLISQYALSHVVWEMSKQLGEGGLLGDNRGLYPFN
jgi:hypothetical protein